MGLAAVIRLRHWLTGLALALLMAFLPGCQLVIGLMMMAQGKPMQPAHFTAKTGKNLNDKTKRVLVLSSADPRALSSHPSLPIDIVQQVSSKLRAHDIKTCDTNAVTRYLESGEVIDKDTDFTALAKELKADFVILIAFETFSTRQENSSGLYRGMSRSNIHVWEMTGSGDKRRLSRIYQKGHDSKYPVHQPIESDYEHPELFQHKFLDLLSEELARHFYDHPPGADIG
jgi:hypothetical protein